MAFGTTDMIRSGTARASELGHRMQLRMSDSDTAVYMCQECGLDFAISSFGEIAARPEPELIGPALSVQCLGTAALLSPWTRPPASSTPSTD